MGSFSNRVVSVMRRNGAVALLGLLAAIGAAAFANEEPTAAFTAYRPSGPTRTIVRFDAGGSSDPDGEIISYQWVFGDGTSGSGMEVEHAFPRVDRYNVGLLVFDSGGAWHRITQTVDLENLSLPPSADGEPEPTHAPPANVPIGNGIGQRAPDFALPDLDGETTHLSDFLGSVVLLEFWKSTCPGCQASSAALEALRQVYGEQGLVILLITLDSSTKAVRGYLADHGFTEFVALRETRGFLSDTVRTYGVKATPTLFLIDRSGVIRYKSFGNLTGLDATPWL